MTLYDLSAEEVTSLAKMPVGVAGGAAAIGLDGRVYVFGGYNLSIANLYQPEVQIYDPSNDSWSLGASMPEAVTIAEAVAMPDGLIYVIGGTNSTDVHATEGLVQIYDPVTDSWSYGPTMPMKLYSGAAVALNDEVIMYMGGSNLDAYSSYSTIYYLNVKDGYWYSSSLELPEKMAAVDAVWGLDGQIYLIGGGRGNTAYGTDNYGSRTGYCLDLFAGEIDSIPDMTIDRKYHSVGVDEKGNIFVIGGISDDEPLGWTTADAEKIKIMDLQLQVQPEDVDIPTGEQMLVIADFNFAFTGYEAVTADVSIRNSDGEVVAISELSAYIAEGNPGYYWVDVPQGLPTGDYLVEFSKLRPSECGCSDLSFDGFEISIGFVHSPTLNEQLEAQNETIGDLQDQADELQDGLNDANDKLDAAATNLMIVMIIAIIAVIVAVVVLVLSLRKKA